jgi:hypothetical protein
VASDYWDSENARRGFILISFNAGAFRLLLPDSLKTVIADIRTGRHAVITHGLHIDEHATMYEVMFEDGSDSPFALWLHPRQIERAFSIADAASQDRQLTVYTRGCVEVARMPVFFREAVTLPCLKPWNMAGG